MSLMKISWHFSIANRDTRVETQAIVDNLKKFQATGTKLEQLKQLKDFCWILKRLQFAWIYFSVFVRESRNIFMNFLYFYFKFFF